MLGGGHTRHLVPGTVIMDYVFINAKKSRDALKLAKEPEPCSYVKRQQWKRSRTRKRALLSTEKKGARVK